jgi:U3 small nucleolar ribonucleoprotein protein IMP3
MSVQSLFLHWYREVTFILCICPPCRRRLSTVLVRLKFCEHLKEAVTYIEQGHIRVGPETVTDPAFLVTRNMEDFVTWVDSSKIKRKVLQYNDQLDDYDAMT